MTIRDALIERLVFNAVGSKYQEFLHPRLKGKWRTKGGPQPMISPVPKPAPGAQTTSPSGQAAPAAISVKPDAAGGTGEAKLIRTASDALTKDDLKSKRNLSGDESPLGSWPGNFDGSVVGWRGVGAKHSFGSSEGIGMYIAKDKETASFFGVPKKVEFLPPERPFVIEEEELYVLRESDELDKPIKPNDSPWLKLCKASYSDGVKMLGESKWDEGTAKVMTETLKKHGYDSVLVRSGGEEWVVLLNPKNNNVTMNTRNALIDALANRCKDRAGKPEGAVENAGTSEGVKKGWLHRLRRNLGASKSTGDAGAESSRLTTAELPHDDEERDKDVIDEGEYSKMSRPEKMHFHATMAKLHRGVARRISRMHPGDKTSKYSVMHFINYHKDEAERHTKGFRLHKHFHEGKASNSTMLAQMSPSPMIGGYARGERRAKNAGTSEGVKKSWAHRHAGLTGPLLMHHVMDVHSEQDHKEMTDYAKKVGQHDPNIGVIPHGWKRVKNSGKSSDSVRWAREFLRKSRANPGKPKPDSTKWAREALAALKAHRPAANDHRGEALEAGIQVELEHGPDRAQAEKIARDHLREDPEYYAKLKRCGVK